jgi:hypothetical protein
MSAKITRKWRALTERRRAHFVELCATGRWKHDYTEQQLRARMHEAVRLAEMWEELSSHPARERCSLPADCYRAAPAAPLRARAGGVRRSSPWQA